MKAPWNDLNIRTAINYAINRQQISTIGYEDANYPEIIPFSAYMAPKWQPGKIQAVMDKYDRGTPSQAKVDEFMGKAGYAKNAAGKWEKGGAVLKVPVYGPSFFGPLAPPLTQQLNDAGFDAAQEIDEKWDAKFTVGNHDTLFLVHCGSLSEPYDTLKDLHSKNSKPIGEAITNVIAGTRYVNPEMDAILDKMDAMPGRSRPELRVHEPRGTGGGHLPPRHPRDHAHRGAPRRDREHHVLDRLHEQGRSVRRPVSLLGGVLPGHVQAPADRRLTAPRHGTPGGHRPPGVLFRVRSRGPTARSRPGTAGMRAGSVLQVALALRRPAQQRPRLGHVVVDLMLVAGDEHRIEAARPTLTTSRADRIAFARSSSSRT